jgi:hypothetical protein
MERTRGAAVRTLLVTAAPDTAVGIDVRAGRLDKSWRTATRRSSST